MTKDEALKLALKTLEQIQEGCSNVIADKLHSDAVDLAKLVRKDCNKPIDAIREALAQPEFVLNGIDCSCGRKWRVVNNTLTASEQPEQEPVATWPSNTQYTVVVQGRELTYWDNIHDAITNARRAVYSGPENTTRALDDLKGGRIAEWSYDFITVRIYPPKNTTPPQREWVGLTEEEIDIWNIVAPSRLRDFVRCIEDKLREKNGC